MTAPPAEWDFAAPSTVPGFEQDDNWLYTPIQASDGSIVAVGFSDKFNTVTTGVRHPSILKYIPGPARKIQWESIPTFQNTSLNITIADSGSGGFNDVFESNENGIKFVYASGIIIKTVAGVITPRIPVIAKFYLSTGVLVYFKEVTGPIAGRFTRMSPQFVNGMLSSIFVAGESTLNGIVKATIFKLTPAGILDISFNGTGFRQYSSPSPNDTKPTLFKDIARAPAVGALLNGFIAVGSVRIDNNPWPQQPQRDVFAVRVRETTGVTDWATTFSETSLGGTYTDDMAAQEIPFCTGVGAPPTTETNNEEGFSVKRMPDGNFAVVSRFDFVELSQAGLPPASQGLGCAPFNTEQYYDNDIAVVKINQSTGTVLYAIDAGRSVAIDAWNVMATNCNEIYISANNFTPISGNPNGGQILASAIRVDDNSGSFTKKWRKDILGKFSLTCIFGICLASDGGVVVVGNNANNGDDYELIKFSSDREMNETFGQTGANITTAVTWNTAKKVKGVITIKPTGTLTIDGATIQFANTYATNDWLTLSQGGGIPTKILIEPQGKLILKNGATLKGLSTPNCSTGTQEWMWEGVVLLGQPTKAPVDVLQGYVEMTSNAKIENAYVGIHAGSTYYNIDGRSASAGNDGGGLIKCQNPASTQSTHFLNCRRSIWYAPVTNTIQYPFTFINTNFVCDQPMVDANFVDPEGNGRIGIAFMVGSWNRDKLKFNTCKFSSTGVYPEIYRGHGVENFDASMTFTGCNFDQLYKGVYAQYGVGVTDPTTLTGCTFNQVRHGGHLIGGSLHTMTGNSFLNIPVNLFNNASYGLRFEGASNLTVSEANSFSSANSGTYGLIIKDSYGNPSNVERNTFTNVDFGVQTEQNNIGLQIRCNGYTGNDRAWSINPATPPNTSGLFSGQGACGQFSNQAGNLFNDPDCPTPGVAGSHIQSRVNFEYSARSGGSFNANEIPTCVSNGPVGTNGIVNIQFCGIISNGDACTVIPPCPNPPCSAAAMASNAGTQLDVWAQQELYKQAIIQYLIEGNMPSATQIAKDHFQQDPNFLLGVLVNSGDYTGAQSQLESIASVPQWNDMVAFYQIMIGLGKSGKTILEIDAAQQSTLQAIAGGLSPSKYAAQNILSLAKGLVFENPVEIWKKDNFDGDANDRSEENKSIEYSKDIGLMLQPNPSDGNVEVRWTPSEGIGTLETFNMSGMLLLCHQVDLQIGTTPLFLKNQPAGVYFVRLRTAAGSTTRKLILE